MTSRLTFGAQRKMAAMAQRVFAQHTMDDPGANVLRAKLHSVGLPVDFYPKLDDTRRALISAGAARDAAQRSVEAESNDRRSASSSVAALVRRIRTQAANSRHFAPDISAWAAASFQPLTEVDSQIDASHALRAFLVPLATIDPTRLSLPADVIAQAEAALAKYDAEATDALRAEASSEAGF